MHSCKICMCLINKNDSLSARAQSDQLLFSPLCTFARISWAISSAPWCCSESESGEIGSSAILSRISRLFSLCNLRGGWRPELGVTLLAALALEVTGKSTGAPLLDEAPAPRLEETTLADRLLRTLRRDTERGGVTISGGMEAGEVPSNGIDTNSSAPGVCGVWGVMLVEVGVEGSPLGVKDFLGGSSILSGAVERRARMRFVRLRFNSIIPSTIPNRSQADYKFTSEH